MTEAPPVSMNFYVIFKNKAQVTTTPPDNSVGTAKISNNAVTVGKLATSGTLPALNGSSLTHTGGLKSVQVFTSSGTYTKPAGIRTVKVIVTGGGGQGGGYGAANDYGAGGGAGGTAIETIDISGVSTVAVTIGAGGSGANAQHIANDFLYGAGITNNKGIKVEALVSNSSVITCLANDINYESIFSEQIKVKANEGDLLLVLSGSGNSMNIIKAIEQAKNINVSTFGIIGYDGGKAKKILDDYIHFQLNDMQIVEDLQMFVCHVCCKWLSQINFAKNK